jgi:ketosteroid isomerase-like protein
MALELRELPRSRLPIWPIFRFSYKHARWAAPSVWRLLIRLPYRWRNLLVAELGRGILGAWHEHDAATLLAVYADDAVIDMSGWQGWLDRTMYQGPDGVRQFFSDWDAAWSDFHFQPTRQVALDPERYLVEIEFEGRGASSGITVRKRFFQIAQASRGLLTRMANYTEKPEALAAVAVLHRPPPADRF